MTYKCQGVRSGGNKCKKTVNESGGYCRHHIDQEVKKEPCSCYLPNGDQCRYPKDKNDFCEYHQEPKRCQGNTLMGELCLKAIASGKYCWNCKGQESVILDSLKNKVEDYRGQLLKEGKIIIPVKKPTN